MRQNTGIPNVHQLNNCRHFLGNGFQSLVGEHSCNLLVNLPSPGSQEEDHPTTVSRVSLWWIHFKSMISQLQHCKTVIGYSAVESSKKPTD